MSEPAGQLSGKRPNCPGSGEVTGAPQGPTEIGRCLADESSGFRPLTRAAAALSQWAAAVLCGSHAQSVARTLKQRTAVVGEDDGCSVQYKQDLGQRARAGQEKLWPQPQLRLAFGFVMWNPESCRPFL